MIDLTGKKFERWEVISFSHWVKDRPYWKCKCICGVERLVNYYKLVAGGSKSCGCYARDQTSKAKKTHGLSKSKFYSVWNDMMMRCYNPRRERYKSYGGRGILVCKRWHSFPNFVKDMYSSYKEGLSLERDDVNGMYKKSNCRWIPLEEQHYNKTNSRFVIIEGVSKTVPEWCKIYGLNKKAIYARLYAGWSDREAIFGKSR